MFLVAGSWMPQLVFGGKDGEPGAKEFVPVEERVRVAGA